MIINNLLNSEWLVITQNPMTNNILNFLQDQSVFANVPTEQLQWLVDNAQYKTVKANEYLFQKDQPANFMNIVLSGKVNVYIYQNQNQKLLAVLKAGDVTGLLPYSRLKVSSGMGIAVEDSEILAFPRESMPDLIQKNPELTQNLIHLMMDRSRDFNQQLILNDKLIALGKLSAGLAHELNNPVSAIVRSADLLKKHLQLLPEGFKNVIKIRLPDDIIDEINGLMFERLANREPLILSALERSDLEDEYINLLESNGLGYEPEIAQNLVEYGFSQAEVQKIIDLSTPTFVEPIIRWINNNLITENMVDEIQQASKRIDALIKSIKSYSYMDQSLDLQAVDIHQGIKNTLQILIHKIKKNNIQVVKELDEEVSTIQGLPGELNQLWTNIIDNALDAMEEQGKGVLTIRTQQYGEFVKVYIQDTGKGISEEIKNRIFDPFFTTKPIGKGTGLGLDIVQKIVNQHNGSLKVDSEVGKTEFMICLPKG